MLSKRLTRIALAVLALSALVASGAALADFNSISDGNRTRGPLDIRAASAGHASAGKLVHTVVTQRRIPRTRRAAFCVRLYFRRPATHGSTFRPVDRFICANGRNTRTHATDGAGRRVGFVRVRRSGNVWSVRFSKRVVRSRTYWWAVDTFYNPSRGVCSGRAGCVDSAPNGRRTVKHHLASSPRFTG